MERPLMTIGALCTTDLSAKQNYAVKLNSAGKIALAGAGEAAIGILYRPNEADKMGTVMILGGSKAILGAAVNNAGTNLTPDANGKLVTAGGGDNVIAITVNASGSSNDIVDVLLVGKATVGTGLSNSYEKLQFPIDLSKMDNCDLVTQIVPGYAGEIVKIEVVDLDPATTAAKTAGLSLEIGAVAVTGGVVSLTSANCTPLGKVNSGTAISATNSFGATDSISVLAANTAVPFIEGKGLIVVTLKQA